MKIIEKYSAIFDNLLSLQNHISNIDFRKEGSFIWEINIETLEIECKDFDFSKEQMSKIKLMLACDLFSREIIQDFINFKHTIEEKIDNPISDKDILSFLDKYQKKLSFLYGKGVELIKSLNESGNFNVSDYYITNIKEVFKDIKFPSKTEPQQIVYSPKIKVEKIYKQFIPFIEASLKNKPLLKYLNRPILMYYIEITNCLLAENLSVCNFIQDKVDELDLRGNVSEFDNELNTQIKEEKKRSTQLKEDLSKYSFNKYLEDKLFNKDSIEKILSLLIEKEVPFCIALLNEIGYLDYFNKEFCKNQVERNNLLGKIFNANPRRIKGNINVLNPKSTDNSNTYTAHVYKKDVKLIINELQ